MWGCFTGLFFRCKCVRVARTHDPAAVDDEIISFDWATVQKSRKAVLYSGGVALLRLKRCTGNVGSHRLIWHAPPGMIFGGGLRVPDVACVAGQMTALHRLD